MCRVSLTAPTITLEDRRNDRVWGPFYDRISGDFEMGREGRFRVSHDDDNNNKTKKSRENAESPKTLTKWLVHKKREGAHQILPIHSIIYRSGGGGGGSAAWHERAGQQQHHCHPARRSRQVAGGSGRGPGSNTNERKTPNKTLGRVGCLLPC